MLPPKTEKECVRLIRKCKRAKREQTIVRARNKLYEKCSPQINKWVKSLFAKWGRFEDEKVIISEGWDCFEHAVKKWTEKCPVSFSQHLYSYTRFCLKEKYRQARKLKRRSKEVSIEDLTNEEKFNLEDFSDDLDIRLGINDLRAFRDVIPDEYKRILDDTIMSMDPDNRKRVRRMEGMTYYKYCEAKKVFKLIVNYMLRGNNK